MPRRYDDDYDRDGDPDDTRRSQRRGKSAPFADVLTDDLGPLPTWGWLVVAVAGVFIWRRIVNPPAAKPLTGTTLPAYPAGQNAGVYFLPQSPGAGAATPAAPAAPAAAAAAPAGATGFGPRYPQSAPGAIPDRLCEPGLFAVSDAIANTWSCATYEQVTSLRDLVAGIAGTPGGDAQIGRAVAASSAHAGSCPPGFQLVNSGAGGLRCVPLYESSPMFAEFQRYSAEGHDPASVGFADALQRRIYADTYGAAA